MKKLYFVVDKSVYSDDATLDGNKTITIYEIIDNVPKTFVIIDSTNDERSPDAIQNWLNDNGHGDDSFELIQL